MGSSLHHRVGECQLALKVRHAKLKAVLDIALAKHNPKYTTSELLQGRIAPNLCQNDRYPQSPKSLALEAAGLGD